MSGRNPSRCWRGLDRLAAGVALAGSAAMAASGPEPAYAPAALEHFEKNVRPVLVNQCLRCHGGEKVEGKLRMDTREALLAGGKTGPAVMPGKPGESLLMKAVRYEHEGIEMPPKGKLEAKDVAAIEAWIMDGAAWPAALAKPQPAPSAGGAAKPEDHWALRRPTPAEPPAVKNHAWARNVVDQFVLAKLEAAKLQPAPEADKRVLIRRAFIDLIGLPPTPEQIAAFLADARPDAYERLLDRLLASPDYGRRWGRHWLDVARYADTSGDGTDMPLPTAYLYRDYVIDAFNSDLPYDDFIREQLAGDILTHQDPSNPRSKDRIVATGFIALSRRFGNSKFGDMHLVIDETLDTVGKGFLGMTISCARCHDHKFDPIPQADYYALAGYFASTQYPHAGSEHGPAPSNLVPITPEGQAYADRQSALAELSDKIDKLNKKRQRSAEDTKTLEEHKAAMKALKASPVPAAPLAWAVTNKPQDKVGDSPMMMRGEPDKLGAKVPRGFLSVIEPAKPAIAAGDSGRLQLADWIASPSNPLTARVMVNRVWMQHFGRGLVATPDSFGKQAKAPSHPELLDHLACAFMDSGWSIKRLHKLIMSSATYRQSSQIAGEPPASDPGNSLYWRHDRRRMDAESIRDGMLLVSGDLDLSQGGEHPFPDLEKERFTQHNPFAAVAYPSVKRSVYLMTQRLHKHPLHALFDGPDANKTTGKRTEATVPLQALYLMNNGFVAERAKSFAGRILSLSGDDAAKAAYAYEAAWGVAASPADVAIALDYIKEYAAAAKGEQAARNKEAWASFARLMLTGNGFFYVE